MFNPWVGKIPWRRERLPTPVFWPGEFHGLYIVHCVPKSRTRPSDFHFQDNFYVVGVTSVLMILELSGLGNLFGG